MSWVSDIISLECTSTEDINRDVPLIRERWETPDIHEHLDFFMAMSSVKIMLDYAYNVQVDGREWLNINLILCVNTN